jgi:hypothetical protein
MPSLVRIKSPSPLTQHQLQKSTATNQHNNTTTTTLTHESSTNISAANTMSSLTLTDQEDINNDTAASAAASAATSAAASTALVPFQSAAASSSTSMSMMEDAIQNSFTITNGDTNDKENILNILSVRYSIDIGIYFILAISFSYSIYDTYDNFIEYQ